MRSLAAQTDPNQAWESKRPNENQVPQLIRGHVWHFFWWLFILFRNVFSILFVVMLAPQWKLRASILGSTIIQTSLQDIVLLPRFVFFLYWFWHDCSLMFWVIFDGCFTLWRDGPTSQKVHNSAFFDRGTSQKVQHLTFVRLGKVPKRTSFADQ